MVGLPKTIVADGEITGSLIQYYFYIYPINGKIIYRRPRRGEPRIAGTILRNGYRMVYVPQKGGAKRGWSIVAHRLVWLAVHGQWPDSDLDHINGKLDDNRISNLRLASESENMANRKLNTNNKVGLKWVHEDKSAGHKKWCAKVRYKGKIYKSMHYSAKEAHAAARKIAKELYGKFFNDGSG